MVKKCVFCSKNILGCPFKNMYFLISQVADGAGTYLWFLYCWADESLWRLLDEKLTYHSSKWWNKFHKKPLEIFIFVLFPILWLSCVLESTLINLFSSYTNTWFNLLYRILLSFRWRVVPFINTKFRKLNSFLRFLFFLSLETWQTYCCRFLTEL